MPDFEKLSEKLSAIYRGLHFKSDRLSKFWKLIWIMETIIVSIILTADTIYNNWKVYKGGPCSIFFRLYNGDIFNSFITIFFSVTLIIFLILPIYSFTIYYSLVCCHLKMIMIKFKNSLEMNSRFDY